MTDANSVKITNNLVIYPHTLILAKTDLGKDAIYMKASAGGASTAFYYKGGKKVGELPTGYNNNGCMLISLPGNWKDGKGYDYIIFYGTEDKMVPAFYNISAVFNKDIKDVSY